MIGKLTLTVGVLLLLSCNNPAHSPNSPERVFQPSFKEFSFASSIRALEVLSPDHVWFAGNNGLFGYTENGGETWTTDSLRYEGNLLEFRSIAIRGQEIFLLTTNSPALLYKSADKGKTWDIVYQETHTDTYYNSLKISEDGFGIAVGDPTNGCLSVIISQDGGNTWERVPCDQLPAMPPDEAGFAASNTNIALMRNKTWIGTGGSKSRILFSPDRGKSWELFQTPIAEGGNMTGIYSIAFYDENHGIIFGGDWEDKDRNTRCKAVTQDSGKTWSLVNDGKNPGFRSCVQYIPGTQGKQLIAVGIPGMSFSADGGNHWEQVSDESYYTIRFSPAGNIAWLAGKLRLARMAW